MNSQLAKNTKVLIVDDQALAKGYMKYSLEELGFGDITYVDKINLALTTIRNQRFDLIICSYNLRREQDGYYFYDEIKANGELPLSTAFVFISADTNSDLVQSIIELQPDDFLAKPFTVKELDRRLSRVLGRKQALKDIYLSIEVNKYDKALSQVELFLATPKNAEFFPIALKIKGEMLAASGQFQQAKEFYQAILKVQTFTWAQLGLVNSYLRLDEDEQAEKLVLRLAFKADHQLAAYDLLTALQIKQNDFDTALECVMMATEISPRSIRRHKTAMNLSRITHDYETQFEAAKKIVRFAKNSIHDKPENYLNVARAGIDYAMTTDASDTDKLIKQAKEYVRQFRQAFPKAEMDDQIQIINARLLYLDDEKTNALALLDQLDEGNWDNDSIDSLLDKAKIFHDLGLHERSQAMLEQIENRCKVGSEQGEIFLHYIHQEKEEKSNIKQSSKELNNSAVDYYQKGDVDNALEAFTKAFTLMPKNTSIALNLLQVISLKASKLGFSKTSKPLLKKCIKNIENSVLNEDQQERYHKIRITLDGV
ncbi:response regulator [Paraglaciecola aquimarina]|uniref:Response regulator n=1 Tax=Paraglaciecola algarum TaxID=3050085 RepID=A0ABS9DC95_9ALTE|nr:response regulator [Paraglaciecola sp. G1-23]MCF2949965.1 response regulator [Paraglaciecola sp. G1-23]